MTEMGKSLIKPVLIGGMVIAALSMTGCNSTRDVLTHGYQLNEDSLSLVPEGSSREQVLLSLGTPSTTQTQHDGSETFYYISQKKARPVAFVAPRVIDQRVLAIYMAKDQTVKQIANYGLKDGRTFDYVRRVTPTGGKDLSFINQILKATPNPASILGGGS